MNIDTEEKPDRIVVDTNILISAFVYGGYPEQVLRTVFKKETIAVISPVLISELLEVLRKKFDFSFKKIIEIESKIKKFFLLYYPTESIHILKDEPDNRLLEVAIEGNCKYIITGDKELLKLSHYKNTYILSAKDFLQIDKRK